MFKINQRFSQDLGSWQVVNAEDFTEMFQGASSYNVSLCAWGPLLQSTPPNVADMFDETTCPETSDPIVNLGGVSGPFCHVCP